MWRRRRRSSPGADPEPLTRSDRGRVARRLGRRGERLARRTLRRSGYRILARNVRTPYGEVDLLARHGTDLVLVEVKTSAAAGASLDPASAPGSGAAHAWGTAQRSRMRRTGTWLARRAALQGLRIRHDLVAVTFDGRRGVVTIRRGVSLHARWPDRGEGRDESW